MVLKSCLVIILTVVVSVIGTHGALALDLENYNALQNEGCQPKKNTWQHFDERSDVSASVKDFLSENGECVRVVVFIGQYAALEDVKVSCNSPDIFTGLIKTNEKLWLFGTVFLKRLGEKSYSDQSYQNKFIVLKVNEDLQTCQKTWWVVGADCVMTCPMKALGKSPHTVKIFEDEDCTDAITQQSYQPMMIYSPNGDVGRLQPTSDWSSFNTWEAVAARIREYRNREECFQLLELQSYGRPVTSMKVACGPLRGVTMTGSAFYYGRTVMIKPVDDVTFTVFYHPRNGRMIDKTNSYTNTIPAVCIKKTYSLVKDNERYISKKMSTVVEYLLGPDCTELVKGKFKGAIVEDEKVEELLAALHKNPINGVVLDAEILNQLKGFKTAKKINDFNLANELGAIVMYFETSGKEKRTLVLGTARGVVLTGALIVGTPAPETLIIREDMLIYNRKLMMKKSADTFTILIGTNKSGCLRSTYILKSSGGIVIKEEKTKKPVDKGDLDCKDLLEGSRLTEDAGGVQVNKH